MMGTLSAQGGENLGNRISRGAKRNYITRWKARTKVNVLQSTKGIHPEVK